MRSPDLANNFKFYASTFDSTFEKRKKPQKRQ